MVKGKKNVKKKEDIGEKIFGTMLLIIFTIIVLIWYNGSVV